MLDLLLERAGVGFCLVSPDGRVLRANVEWLRSTGFPLGEVLGADVVGLFPDGRELALALHARARAGQHVDVPRHALRLNGRETWWEGSIDPVSLDGGTGLLITAREVPGPSGAIDGAPAAIASREPVSALPEATAASEILELGDAFCELDAGFRVVRVNARQERLTGVPRAQSLGRTHWELWPDSARPDSPWWREYHRCMRERVPVAFEDYYAPLDLWSSVTAYPTSSGGIAIFFRDISGQKRGELELRESEARYRTLFTNMTEGFALGEAICDAAGVPRDFRFLEMNDGFELQSGLRRETTRGRPMREVLPGLEQSWVDTYCAVALGAPAQRFESYNRDLDRHFSVYCFSPTRGRFAILFTDVTERVRREAALRESEQRLRVHVESTPLALVEWDQEYRVVGYSARARELFGFAPEEVLGKRIDEIPWVPEEDWPKVRAVMHDMATGSRPVNVNANRNVRKDGSALHCEWYNSSLYDDAGRLRSVVSLVLDVTERTRAERALLEANERLREADRRKDEFLGMLSHELRNPLAPIRNSTYLLRHAEPGSPRAQRAQAVIERQAEHLTRLVDDLLDVTRIARGKIELRRGRVDLREVVSRAAEDFRALLHDHGVRFAVALPPDPVWAEADATRITQVVGNLLHNAAKFTQGGDEVAVSLEAGPEAATLRVRDTGAGMDPDLLPLVFEPFVQGERTLARTDGGLGLGLALVKAIAVLHGGTVRADSAGKGRGAEFTVTLPLAVQG